LGLLELSRPYPGDRWGPLVLIARTMTGFLAYNPVFADTAGQARFGDLTSVRGYAATLFMLLTVPVGGSPPGWRATG
jgi:hypothetical protein